jgi:hypothetical protein
MALVSPVRPEQESRLDGNAAEFLLSTTCSIVIRWHPCYLRLFTGEEGRERPIPDILPAVRWAGCGLSDRKFQWAWDLHPVRLLSF